MVLGDVASVAYFTTGHGQTHLNRVYYFLFWCIPYLLSRALEMNRLCNWVETEKRKYHAVISKQVIVIII